MKSFNHVYSIILNSSFSCLLFCLLLLIPVPGLTQVFQRSFGDALDNSFSKVIKDGSNYYVLGQTEPGSGTPNQATVTRLDANGLHQWTLSLTIASEWNDAILLPGGDLLVVGSTLPFDASTASLMGRITASGAFTWLRSYDVPGRDFFNRIVENPSPQLSSFPYYLLGGQNQPGSTSTTDDVVLLNLDANGSFNWKKIYVSPGDNEFFRDLDALPNGDLLLAGNETSGIVYKTDKAGGAFSGVQIPQLFFSDVAVQTSGGFYASANELSGPSAYLMKFDQDMLLQWDAKIPQLSAINQVWEGPSGDIYATGRGNFSGTDRDVIIKLLNNGPSIVWVKYLNTGSSFSGGSSWSMPNNEIAFTDSRVISGGFGGDCAFISVSDLDLLNTCMVSEDMVTLEFIDPFPDGPEPPTIDFQDIPMGINLLETASLNWQQAEVCNNEPCAISLDVIFIDSCGHVQVNSTTTGPMPYSYQWCSGENTPNIDVQLPCGPNTFCVTVTCGDGSTATATQTITVIDNIPPVAICIPPEGVILDANCMYIVTPEMIDDGSFDNCQIQSMSVSPTVLNGCGIFPVTLTVVDWCGNISTCMTEIQTIEDIPPVIICPQDMTVSSSSPAPCEIVVDGIQWLSATDNCSTPTISYNITGATILSGNGDASGQVFGQGISTVTYTATDVCGNTADCSFTVTVECAGMQSIFECGMAVVTCFSGMIPTTTGGHADPNGPVIALVDLRNHATAPLGANWSVASSSGIFHYPDWDAEHMGQVFGVTIDNNYNVYASSSTIYGKYLPPNFPVGGFGNVYKIDASNGAISTFATLLQDANDPAGLGDVWYDVLYNQIFVSNFHDGLIYRYDMSGTALGTYDFIGTSLGAPSPGFIARGERVWAVATNANKLYFSVWIEDRSRIEPTLQNQIWSVQLDNSGAPILGSEILVKNMPNLLTNQFSSPVSDISFSETGVMLLAERSMNDDYGDATANAGAQAHASRIIELSGANWGNDKIFYVGNAGVHHVNSSGGIDYGYDSFDPLISPSPLLCDSMIWGTGDALRFPGYNNIVDPSTLPCGGSTGDYVYGLAGIPKKGNSNLQSAGSTYVNNSSIYIDVDNNLCSGQKLQIGDVDVFKNCITCPDIQQVPCDSLMVTINEFPTGNQCCFSVDIKNNYGPNISKLQIDLCTPGVYINTQHIGPGYQFTPSNSNQSIQVTHVNGSIPTGISNDIIRFCYSGTSGPGTFPQTLKFTWFQNVGGSDIATECIDTTHTDCIIMDPPIEDSCIVVTPLDIECDLNNPYEYILSFKITNLSSIPSFNAYTVNLYGLPSGFTFSPCIGPSASLSNISIPIPGAPLLPLAMSGNMCVKIVSSTPILSPQTICAKAKLIGIEDCCTVDEEFCITLEPCCDPCESIAITTNEIQQDSAECCYSLGVINECPYPYFTKIEAEITTAGVTYGYYALNSSLLGFWSLAGSTPTKLCIRPNGGTISAGTIPDLVDFCLDNINNPNQVPQSIVIRWMTSDVNGLDSLACDTTLTFECEVPIDYKCLVIDSIDIVCLADSSKYRLTFTVTNTSTINFCATMLDFILLSPSDLIFSPSASYTFPTPLCQNQSQTVSICLFDIDGLPGSGNLVFIPRLSFMDQDTCCYEAMPVEIPLPACDSCHCGGFSDMFVRTGGAPSQQVFCDSTTVGLACPNPGFGYALTGVFKCEGNDCPTDYQIDWNLTGPGTINHFGSFSDSDPYWGINLLPTYFTQSGTYTMTLKGHCGTDECLCVIKFEVDCPDFCPCEQDDIQAVSDAVDKGFATSLSNNTCKACFSPIALSECETVQWFLNSTSGTPIGTSNGQQTFCTTFSASGTYTVLMVVTRKKPDGSICEVFTKSQTVTVSCGNWPDCTESVYPNPRFSEGAVAGILNMGGSSNGWTTLKGNPEVVEGLDGSYDGWTLQLVGNLDSMDVVTSIDPICLDKVTDLLTVRIWGDPHIDHSKKKFDFKVKLFQDGNFIPSDCIDDNCFEIASIDLSPIDTGWIELQIPYDLTDWSAFDSCGGVYVRPAIYLESQFTQATGSAVNPTARRIVQLDNFCMGGMIVATDDLPITQNIHLFPNPTTGSFTLRFEGEGLRSGQLQIIDLWGRTVITQTLDSRLLDHTINLESIPTSIYFIQITENGIPVWSDKIVKQ